MSDRPRILAHLKENGPQSSEGVAAALGLDRRMVTKNLSEMVRLGTATRIPKPWPGLYGYGREPVSQEERLQRARDAYSVVRPRRDVEAERKKAREYRQKNAERLALQRRARYEKAKASQPERVARIPKPKPNKPEHVKVKPSRRIKEDGAFVPAQMTRAVAEPRPDTDAFLRANPGALIRLKPGETSQPRDTLTAAQRRAILTLSVAA